MKPDTSPNEKEPMKLQRYRLLFGMALFMHSALCITFAVMGVKILFYFNIFSVIFYLSGVLFIRSSTSGIWQILFFLEVVAHVAMCNIFLGWGYGFGFYGIMIIPVTYYLSYLNRYMVHDILTSHLLSAINLIVILITTVTNDSYNRLGSIPNSVVRIAFCINCSICAVALIMYSTLFVVEVKMITRALRDNNKELNFLANYDSLTHLRNRHRMKDMFAQYQENEENYCVILGDIDDFKKVNDTYSHSCGDLVLKTVASTILKIAEKYGVICRWGGEEILLLLATDKEKGYALAEQIREEINSHIITYENQTLGITMTFGIAGNQEEGNIEKMIAIADERLYTGKRAGKNQVVGK